MRTHAKFGLSVCEPLASTKAGFLGGHDNNPTHPKGGIDESQTSTSLQMLDHFIAATEND
jgi:hypothetical protein